MVSFQYKYLGFAAMSAAAFAVASCATPQSEAGQSSAAKTHANCTQTFSPAYAPPTKIGGSGRIIQVPGAIECPTDVKVEIKKAGAASPGAKIREARFTSTPPGAVVAVYGLKDDPRKILPKICKTPCSQNLDAKKSWRATALMADGTNEDLPVPFHPLDETGMGIDFTTEAPFQVTLNTLDAVPLNAANSVYQKGVEPLKLVPPVAPRNAGKSGRCTIAFDITDKGVPTNIRAKTCSDNVYRNSSLKMIASTSYAPKLRNGVAVGITGVEQSSVFQLLDRGGKVLPE